MDKLYIIAFVQLLLCVHITSAQDVVLHGRIIRSGDSTGVENAFVYVDSTKLSAYTDASGRFSFGNLSAGAHTLFVSHLSFQNYREEIHLHGSTDTLSITLDPLSSYLGPVVITGTGTSHSLENVPVQTEIITNKDLKEVSSSNLEDVISNIASSFDFTTSSMGTNIKLNGLGKDYVLVLVNGKRLMGTNGGYADLSRINIEDIQQIEIIKGATSTLYGSDAIAGVINIITKKPKKNLTVTNSSRYGAYNQFRQMNSLSFGIGKLSSKTSFSYSQKDGWQLNNMEFNSKWKRNHDLPYLVESFDMPVNKKWSYTVSQHLDYDISKKLNVYAEGSWYEKRLFFPFRGRNYNYYYNNVDALIGSKYSLSKKSYIECTTSFGNYTYFTEYPNKYNESYITPEGLERVTYYPGDRFKNSEEITLVSQLKGVFSLQKHTLNIGGEFLTNSLESQYRLTKDNVSDYTYSLYVQDEYKLSKNIDLVGGVRFIYNEMFGFIATPKLAGMYKLGRFNFRLNYANGFKSPTLKELYYYYESQRMGVYRLYMGNENLKPQRSDYFSASAEFKYKWLKTSVTGYLNRLKDMIDYQIIETSYTHARRGIEETKMRYNILGARNTGADYSIDLTFNKSWNLAFGYSYVDAKNLTQNIRLNGVSEHSASWKAAWNRKWKWYSLYITLSGSYKSDKFYLEEDMERTYAVPYQLWVLTTSHRFNTFKNCDLDFIAGIDNVFNYIDDRPYGSHYATLNPGRTVFAGLKFKFRKQTSEKQ